jgi:hypothetical protein
MKATNGWQGRGKLKTERGKLKAERSRLKV